MNVASILAMVSKGVTVIQTLAAAEQDVAPAVKVVKDLITGAQAGTVTAADLATTEATLDRLIADFNEPMT